MDESCAIQTLSSSCIKIARQLKTVSLIKSNFLGSPHIDALFISVIAQFLLNNSSKATALPNWNCTYTLSWSW